MSERHFYGIPDVKSADSCLPFLEHEDPGTYLVRFSTRQYVVCVWRGETEHERDTRETRERRERERDAGARERNMMTERKIVSVWMEM